MPLRVLRDDHLAHWFHDKVSSNYIVMDRSLRPLLADARVVVDVGANVGIHTIWYLREFPFAHVHAIEPQSVMFNLLRHNVDAWSMAHRVTLHNFTLGHQDGEVSMARESDVLRPTGFHYGALSVGENGERVGMRRLDSLNLESCDFVKVDVEGFEPLVLIGAQETLKRFRPVLLLENTHPPKLESLRSMGLGSAEIPSLHTVLEALGYSYVSISSEDILALPKEKFEISVTRKP